MSGLVELMVPAFTLGILGSWHCLGMCGPLMFSLSLQIDGRGERVSILRKILIALYYHTMRILSYGTLGFIVGMLGGGVIKMGGEGEFVKMQRYLSIFSGTVLILWGLLYQRFFFLTRMFGGWEGKINLIIQKIMNMASSFPKKHPVYLGVIGLFHGWLPCGLVYAAATAALGYGSPELSLTFMLFFGLGTFPSMVLVFIGFRKLNDTIIRKLNDTIRLRIKKIIPISLLLLGVFFVLRGMSLGIPFLSPPLH